MGGWKGVCKGVLQDMKGRWWCKMVQKRGCMREIMYGKECVNCHCTNLDNDGDKHRHQDHRARSRDPDRTLYIRILHYAPYV